MLVRGQVGVVLVDQQHRGGARAVAGRHVVEAVADHDDVAAAAALEAPRPGDVQDARRVRLGRPEVARHDGVEVVAREEAGEEVGYRGAL